MLPDTETSNPKKSPDHLIDHLLALGLRLVFILNFFVIFDDRLGGRIDDNILRVVKMENYEAKKKKPKNKYVG